MTDAGPAGGHRAVARTLTIGLLAAAVLFAVGTILAVATGLTEAPDLRVSDLLHGPVADRLQLAGVLAAALTPALGLLTVLVVRLRERDRRWAALTALVLILLVTGAIVLH